MALSVSVGVSLLAGPAPPVVAAEGPEIVATRYVVVAEPPLSVTGGFPMDVAATLSSPACAMTVSVLPGESEELEPVGTFPMTGTTFAHRVLVQTSIGEMGGTGFVLQAQACDGALGPPRSTVGFIPGVRDDRTHGADDDAAFVPVSGSWRRRTDDQAYRGGYTVSTSGLGARMRVRSTWGDFGAVYAVTGPDGGKAAVYLSGKRVATVSFFSRTRAYRRLVYAFSGPEQEGLPVDFVAIAAGRRGGTRLMFDAFVDPVFD